MVDNRVAQRVTATQLGQTTWSQTVDQGFYLVMNLAMGGAFPNAVAGKTTPTSNTISGAAMHCDYIAVYST